MSGVVNINTASVDQIAQLPGIGASIAARIVERRVQKPFTDASEVMRVRGVGEKTFQRLAKFIVVSGKTTFVISGAKSKGQHKSNSQSASSPQKASEGADETKTSQSFLRQSWQGELYALI